MCNPNPIKGTGTTLEENLSVKERRANLIMHVSPDFLTNIMHLVTSLFSMFASPSYFSSAKCISCASKHYCEPSHK